MGLGGGFWRGAVEEEQQEQRRLSQDIHPPSTTAQLIFSLLSISLNNYLL
jgi:hypothetical protein